MNYPFKILFKSFIKPFYKENAGPFVFVFTMMFYIVGSVDGTSIWDYHYSLIMAMMTGPAFLLIVFAGWFLYARKCVAFVSTVMNKPEYSFLHIYNCLDKRKLFRLFLLIEILLLLPILLYGLVMIIVGFYKHFYIPAIATAVYLLLFCIMGALYHVQLLQNPYKTQIVRLQRFMSAWIFPSSYPFIILRFVASRQKMIWLGTKVFTCGVLYLIARNNEGDMYDTRFTFMFFNFGVLANGILVFRIRQFEEMYLRFYRGMSIPLWKRCMQYAFVFFILMIPEMITVIILAPVHLHNIHAAGFILSAYSLVLLMNSITYLQNPDMKEFLKIILLIFCVQYIFLMAFGLIAMSVVFLVLSSVTFFRRYYKHEWT